MHIFFYWDRFIGILQKKVPFSIFLAASSQKTALFLAKPSERINWMMPGFWWSMERIWSIVLENLLCSRRVWSPSGVSSEGVLLILFGGKFGFVFWIMARINEFNNLGSFGTMRSRFFNQFYFDQWVGNYPKNQAFICFGKKGWNPSKCTLSLRTCLDFLKRKKGPLFFLLWKKEKFLWSLGDLPLVIAEISRSYHKSLLNRFPWPRKTHLQDRPALFFTSGKFVNSLIHLRTWTSNFSED